MNKLFDIKPRSLYLSINNGCYFLDNEAAIGKTYLGTLLKKLNEADKLSARVITYKKDASSNDIIGCLKKNHYEVVLFDRLDLYITEELCEFLAKNCEDSIYLLDIKNLNKVKNLGLKYADLLLTENRIEVISV